MRILVDTNVWISFFLGSERIAEVIEDCYFRHELLTSKGVIHELKSVLIKKLHYSEMEIELALTFIHRRSRNVEGAFPPVNSCRDPGDNHVLSAGIAGSADCILTGDSDLLTLKRFQNIAIISPREFRAFEEK